MDDKKRVILVDENMASLSLGKEALAGEFDVLTVPSGEKLFQALRVFPAAMILLDMDMPEADGFETLRRLKMCKQAEGIPVLILSAQDDQQSILRALDLGATDFVTKPYVPQVLRNLVRQHLRVGEQQQELARYEAEVERLALQKRTSLLQLQDAFLDTVIALAQSKNPEAHSRSAGEVRAYLSAMVEEMYRSGVYDGELSLWNNDVLIASAQMHDIGKIIVRDKILQKPGRLTPEEFEIVKNHTILGVKVIESIERSAGSKPFFDHAKLFAGAHHERWDGAGYPLGLRAEEIPLQGRMMAIVDVYDALVSQRPYKKPFSHAEARSIIAQSRGTQFDPLLLEVFLSVSDAFEKIKKRMQ